MNNKNENIENEELKVIAPILFSLKRQNNFNIPKDYFEILPEKIVTQIDSKEKLNVPSDYFDNLADEIFEKIKKEETKVIPLRKKPFLKVLSIAASITILLTLGYTFFKTENNKLEIEESISQYENITVEEVQNANSYLVNEDLICSIDFGENFETNLDIDYQFNDVNLDFTSDEIDEYLSSDYYLDVEF